MCRIDRQHQIQRIKKEKEKKKQNIKRTRRIVGLDTRKNRQNAMQGKALRLIYLEFKRHVTQFPT